MSEESASKKRKISGSERDLLTQLREFRLSVAQAAGGQSDPDAMPAAAPFTGMSQLDTLINTLESQIRVNNAPMLSFSAPKDEMLKKFNIIRKGMLFLHPRAVLSKAIDNTRSAGSDKLWSDNNMYNHLSFLAGSFANINETSFQLVIDTFFFRLAAIIPLPWKVIMMLENHVSAVHPRLSQTDMVSGQIDYTAIVAKSSTAEIYIYHPPNLNQAIGDEVVGFFAAEAKGGDNLIHHLPQVVVELVACAKQLEKSHIRGALTTGFKWYFVVVDLDGDGDGAKYWVSEPIQWSCEAIEDSTSGEHLQVVEPTSDKSDPALIVGILSSWILKSSEEFKGDQWFYQKQVECG